MPDPTPPFVKVYNEMTSKPRKRRRLDSDPSSDGTLRSGKQQKTSPFAGLPTELLQHVWTFCDAETLKRARLGCSMWAYHMIGPFLFNTVILIPHLYFMERFFWAFRSSPLTKHIKELVIDVRWVEQMLRLKKSCKTSKGSYDHEHRAHDTSCYTLEQLRETYHRGRTEHLRSLESAALAAMLSPLTSLASLEVNFWRDPFEFPRWVTEFPDNFPPQAPSALRALLDTFDVEERFLGASGGERNFREPSVFWSIAGPLSTAVPQLKELALLQFDPLLIDGSWSDPFMSYATDFSCDHPFWLYSQVFSRLSHLDMRLTAADPPGLEREVVTATARILRLASKLSSLRLVIQDVLPCQLAGTAQWNDPELSPRDNCIPVLQSFLDRGEPSVGLPHLRTLELQNVICEASHLGHFLLKGTPNLQSLTLKNFILFTPDLPPGASLCWILTFKWMRRNLRLTAVDFGGYLTNMGKQHWHITDDSACPEPSVKSRMINWFLDRSAPDKSCPLNVFELAEGELGVSQEDDILRHAAYESWSMICPTATWIRPASTSDASGSESDLDCSAQVRPHTDEILEFF